METQYTKNSWAWWKDALAGKDVPRHDEAMQGFYALKPSAKARPIPVAVWYVGERLVVLEGGKWDADSNRLVDGKHRDGALWISLMRNPISKATYDAAVRDEPWPEEIRIVAADGSTDSSMMGDNAANDDEKILGDVREWTDQLRRLLKKGAPTNKKEADALSDVATKLAELCADADARRDELVRPHLTAQREFNTKFNSLIVPGKDQVKSGKMAVAVYMREEQRRRDEEARRIAEEAAAKAAAEAGPSYEMTETVLIKAAPVKVGTRGRSIALTQKAVVDWGKDQRENFALAMAYLAGMDPVPPDVFDVAEKAVLRLLRAGITVPGAKVKMVDGAR